MGRAIDHSNVPGYDIRIYGNGFFEHKKGLARLDPYFRYVFFGCTYGGLRALYQGS